MTITTMETDLPITPIRILGYLSAQLYNDRRTKSLCTERKCMLFTNAGFPVHSLQRGQHTRHQQLAVSRPEFQRLQWYDEWGSWCHSGESGNCGGCRYHCCCSAADRKKESQEAPYTRHQRTCRKSPAAAALASTKYSSCGRGRGRCCLRFPVSTVLALLNGCPFTR